MNRATLLGNLGNDPDVKTMQSGDEVVNLSIATTESWKDKNSGERKSKTEWHRVVIFSQGLVKVAKTYLKKGSKVLIEGKIQTRSWEQDGQKKYATEIVLNGFDAKLVMLDSRNNGDSYNQDTSSNQDTQQQTEELEDEIPF